MQRKSIEYLCLLLGLFGCTGQQSDKKLKPEVTHEYVKSVYALPLTLDPSLMNDGTSLLASNMIYDGLLRLSPTLEVEAAIAELWETSSDGKSLIFHIRKNAKFHDGSTITSSDVIYSLTRNLSSKSKVYKYYDCILGADEYFAGKTTLVQGLVPIGSDQVEIKLKYAFPPIISVLAGATAKIYPKSSEGIPNFFKKPIGSGPFRFDRIDEQKREMILAKNPDYYATVPAIERLTLKETDQNKAMELAAQGSIQDLSNWPLTGAEDVFKSGVDVDSPVTATWVVGLNTRKSVFRDLKIRKAFIEDLQTEKFREKFYPDALPASGYVPFGLPGYREKQSSALEQAITVSKHPVDSISIQIPAELTRAKEMADFITSQLKPRGWNVQVSIVAWDKLMEGYNKKNLDAFLVSMNVDYPDVEFLIRNFESNNPDNFSGIKDTELDQLIKKSRTIQDRKERLNVYDSAVDRLNSLALTANLFHPRAHYWIGRCVRGFVPNLLAEYYIDYSKIWMDSDCLKSGGKK